MPAGSDRWVERKSSSGLLRKTNEGLGGFPDGDPGPAWRAAGRWAHWWMTSEQLQEQESVTADDLKDARKKYRDREDALWAGDE